MTELTLVYWQRTQHFLRSRQLLLSPVTYALLLALLTTLLFHAPFAAELGKKIPG